MREQSAAAEVATSDSGRINRNAKKNTACYAQVQGDFALSNAVAT